MGGAIGENPSDVLLNGVLKDMVALWLFISPRPKFVTTRGLCAPLPPRILIAASWLMLFLLPECPFPGVVGVCVWVSATFLNVIVQATSSPAKTHCSRKRT